MTDPLIRVRMAGGTIVTVPASHAAKAGYEPVEVTPAAPVEAPPVGKPATKPGK